jgi:hypothetical protein
MRLEKGLLLISFIALTACASNNNSTPASAGPQTDAAQLSSKGHTETIQSASGEKCVVDEDRICKEGTPAVSATNDPYYAMGQEIRDRVASGDETAGRPRATVSYTLSLLQGERPVILVCGMNPRRHTLAYAQLSGSGTPTDTDIAKVRAAGYCSQ